MPRCVWEVGVGPAAATGSPGQGKPSPYDRAPSRARKAKVFFYGGWAAVIPWLRHGLQDVARFTGSGRRAPSQFVAAP